MPWLVGPYGAQWFAEGVAAFGLIATILDITAAYWFTASTSFANPAVAIARGLTNTFAGIRPVDLPGFIAAELAGALCGLVVMAWLLRPTPGLPPLDPEAQL